MQETHVYVSGKVQRVGFRSLVKRHALLHDIKGYVRNLADGRVEICAQGRGDQIQEFIRTVQEKPGAAVISEVETQYQPVVETFSSFEIC